MAKVMSKARTQAKKVDTTASVAALTAEATARAKALEAEVRAKEAAAIEAAKHRTAFDEIADEVDFGVTTQRGAKELLWYTTMGTVNKSWQDAKIGEFTIIRKHMTASGKLGTYTPNAAYYNKQRKDVKFRVKRMVKASSKGYWAAGDEVLAVFAIESETADAS